MKIIFKKLKELACRLKNICQLFTKQKINIHIKEFDGTNTIQNQANDVDSYSTQADTHMVHGKGSHYYLLSEKCTLKPQLVSPHTKSNVKRYR